jgi:hypothetical protein
MNEMMRDQKSHKLEWKNEEITHEWTKHWTKEWMMERINNEQMNKLMIVQLNEWRRTAEWTSELRIT